MRVHGYVRVSGAEQGRTGTSLEGQRAEIEAYCKASGHPTPTIHVEVESAGAEKLDRRHVLRELLTEVRAGDLVIVTKQDRWSRDTLFYLSSTREIVARGARFFSIAERFDPATPEGRFAATIMAAVAEQERERIRERTVGRRRALRDQGRYIEGLPPIGYRRGPGNILEVVDEDAAIVRDVFARSIGGQSVVSIAEDLQVAHPTRHGWDTKTILSMLRSRTYLGQVRTTRDEWIQAHPPIIDLATRDAALAGLAARRLHHGRKGQAPRTEAWLLKGLAKCGQCGSAISAAYSRTRDYYMCFRRCGLPYVRVDHTDVRVTAMVEDRLVELRDLLRGPAPPPEAPVDHGPAIARLRKKRERLVDIAADGAISRTDLSDRLARVDAEIARLSAAPIIVAPRRAVRILVGDMRKAWRVVSIPERREILRSLASRIEITPDPVLSWRSPEELSVGNR